VGNWSIRGRHLEALKEVVDRQEGGKRKKKRREGFKVRHGSLVGGTEEEKLVAGA